MSKIVITGITGQDGSYMADYCLNLGHQVFGMVRRTSQIHDKNYQHLLGNSNFKVVYGDLIDASSINSVVNEIQPDYFINFAAQSFVGASWRLPEETFMSCAVGVLKCLEAIRKYKPSCRFYNAGSSEQFGDVVYSPQDENHLFRPRSPYGAAKCAAHHLVKVYRESYNLYAIQGLLFNHESERRGEEFVTRKITKGVARIKKAINNKETFDPIELGNLDAKRDWSHAEDFIDGIWRMMNQNVYRTNLECFDTNKPQKYIKEYVLSSGENHSIREFVSRAFYAAGIIGNWSMIADNPQSEQFVVTGTPSIILVKINPLFYRPAEVDVLMGNASLAQKELGWKPKISFDNLVKRMVEYDLAELGLQPYANTSQNICQAQTQQ